MPIYEFYCEECNTIYNFLSRSVNTEKRPPCPGCGKDSLDRRMSGFAVISGGKTEEEPSGPDMPPIDEAKMERAVEKLASEAEGIDEKDPRAAARLMRKFSDMTGLQYGESMEQALGRMEDGDDPEKIESEMGDLLEGDEEPFVMPEKRSGKKRHPTPKRDDHLYEM